MEFTAGEARGGGEVVGRGGIFPAQSSSRCAHHRRLVMDLLVHRCRLSLLAPRLKQGQPMAIPWEGGGKSRGAAASRAEEREGKGGRTQDGGGRMSGGGGV